MKSENDDGDDGASSLYSSCGESENDRYLSANSAMGTPSVCSSITVFNDCSELEFGGSSRSLGLGLESFSLGGEKVESNGWETKRLSDETTMNTSASASASASVVNYGSGGFELYGNESDEIGFSGFDNGLMAWNRVESESLPSRGLSGFDNDGSDNNGEDDEEEELEGVGDEMLGKCSDLEQISGLQVENLGPGDPREKQGLDGNVKAMEGREDGASSMDEHSEGEGSMYNYGLDDDEDGRVEIGFYSKEGYHVEVKTRHENPLLINSSVAFGSEDWDDFMLESGRFAIPLDSLPVAVSEKREEKRSETKKEVSDSTPVKSGEHTVEMPVSSNQVYDKLDDIIDKSIAPSDILDFGELSVVEDVKDIPLASCQVQGSNDVIEFTKSSFTTNVTEKVQELEKEDLSQIPCTKDPVGGGDGLSDFLRDNSLDNVCDIELDPLTEEFPEKISLLNRDDSMQLVHKNMSNEETIILDDNHDPASSKIKQEHVDDSRTNPVSSGSTVSSRETKFDLLEDSKKKPESFSSKNNRRKNPPLPNDHGGEHPMPVKTEARELNEFYDEVVLEMEEILLASNESPGARFPHSNRALQSQLSLPIRDGGSSASTSGTNNAYPFFHQPLRIDGVEVVGARQKKGDVSLGERLVGVKEYTVYRIRVWSGNEQWEVERRYRDFSTLHHRLKTLFASQDCFLPSPWATVEKESRKLFGNVSPDVVAERSVLIQECLQSIIHPRFYTLSSSSLIWFLSPQDSVPGSPASTISESLYLGNRENTLGKTISLIVEIQPYKSVRQMLEAQHYTCAGCYKHFDDGKTLIRDFAQTLGWGKPRLCEYTSQLFCTSCHTNETAVLPARVLHNWDFAQYPVSQLAKSYLDSINDQPMLCVSAVNPFLFSKVPTLLHVMGVRRKIGSILAYVRCPFRGAISRGLGPRRYLLESNDFFALKDLIDLSKGAFAVLPIMVETLLKNIIEHITEQCLVCCDVGLPCGARQACNDLSSLIFPFQEGNVEKCPSCETEFHKACIKKLTDCHCGARLRADAEMGLTRRLSHGAGGESSRTLDFLGKGLGSGLSVGFLSGLFSKAKPERSLGEHKDSDNVILMGSLPSTTL